MTYLTLDDVVVSGKTVLVRADYNVPLSPDGSITDDFRIRSSVPTLERLVNMGATVEVCSHLGRPDGEDGSLSLQPVADRLNDLSRLDVRFGRGSGGDVRVLENTRFHSGEEDNSPAFAAQLADGVDLFVQDAFGSVHRAHASTVGVAERVRSVAGPLLDDELKAFARFTDDPEQPYTLVLGGAKISDKLGVISNLIPKVDRMLIGGGMCFTLLAARGESVGASMVEEEMVDVVAGILEGPFADRIVLPIDVVAATAFSPTGANRIVDVHSLSEHEMGLDIGPATANLFADTINRSRTVFWNGPMGVFEWTAYRHGTERVASAIATTPAFTGVGGGDSVAAMRLLGYDDGIDHLSTGGGAGLELLEGRILPGVAALEKWAQ
ncbi:MAG TPA: phosphoglycerate kinase [Acidimicrobiia bacterium]